MNHLTKINYLIDQHVEIPYKECPGCHYCDEIKKISKESGLWLGDSLSKQIQEGKKRAEELTKEKLKPYLDQGLSIREISKREGFHETTISRRIKQWFPEYLNKKKGDAMPFDQYMELRERGYNDSKISREVGITYSCLRHQLMKWQKAGKFSGQAI